MDSAKCAKKGAGILVVYKGQSWSLAVDKGNLHLNALKKCFPTATGLYCSRNVPEKGDINEIITVDREDNLKIADLNLTYYPYIPQENYENASVDACKEKEKKKSVEAKEDAIKLKSERKATIIWKHRENEVQPFKPNSAFHYKDKIILSTTKEYSLKELSKESVNVFLTSKTKWFFQNCSIDLGIGSDTIVNKFKNEDGSACTFWEYARLHRDTAGKLNLYLLTTSLKIDSTRTNSSVLRSVDSNSIHGLKRSTDSSYSSEPAKKKVDSTLDSKIKEMKDNNKKNLYLESKAGELQSANSAIFKVPNAKPKVKSPRSIPSSSFTLNLKSSIVHSKRYEHGSYEMQLQAKNSFSQSSIRNDENIESKQSEIEIRIPQISSSELESSSKILGEGGQGTVVLGKWKDTKVAIKKIRLKYDDLLLKREILMMERVRHENFINIMAVAFDATHAHLVMEYFPSINLWDIIFNYNVKKHLVSEEMKNKLGLQICNGLNYLHNTLDNFIIHDDIKPSNILVNNFMQVKLCDLGLAKCNIMQEELQTQANISFNRGTVIYMSPELVNKQSKPTRSSDVWAVGCTLLEMYNEESVWKLRHFSLAEDLAHKFSKKEMPVFKKVPSLIQKSIECCFDYDYKKRIDIGVLLEVYRHRLYDLSED